jgi:hypothetical protein
MRQAALPAAARFTCQSDSSRQCFGHPCLPARARSLPTRQCFRWQSDRDRCTRPARLRSSTWFQHLGSRCGAEDFRQHLTRLASTRKSFLRPRRVLTIRLLGIRLALHIVSLAFVGLAQTDHMRLIRPVVKRPMRSPDLGRLYLSRKNDSCDCREPRSHRAVSSWHRRYPVGESQPESRDS